MKMRAKRGNKIVEVDTTVTEDINYNNVLLYRFWHYCMTLSDYDPRYAGMVAVAYLQNTSISEEGQNYVINHCFSRPRRKPTSKQMAYFLMHPINQMTYKQAAEVTGRFMQTLQTWVEEESLSPYYFEPLREHMNGADNMLRCLSEAMEKLTEKGFETGFVPTTRQKRGDFT